MLFCCNIAFCHNTDSRFGKCEDFIKDIQKITKEKGIFTIPEAEPIGPKVLLDVLEEILKYIVVEKATFADEALRVTPEFHEKAKALLPAELPVEYIPHTELKARSANAKAIILTGEFTGYTNVILTAGCAY